MPLPYKKKKVVKKKVIAKPLEDKVKPHLIKWYGWKPSPPDHRDYQFDEHNLYSLASLPSAVDLRSGFLNIYDQDVLGSCTGQAIAALIEYLQGKLKIARYTPSRLFIYYQERVLEGTVKVDCGAYIRDGMKVVNKWGAPPETYWPYVIRKFAIKPTNQSYIEGAKHLVTKYMAVTQSATGIKTALASGYPVVCGFSVYESFEATTVSKTGIVPMPGRKEKFLGGHAILIVGYDDSKNWYICRNSWGKGWGDKGYFYMPYDYLNSSKYASDFWTATITK